jgi:hypothetical protein
MLMSAQKIHSPPQIATVSPGIQKAQISASR